MKTLDERKHYLILTFGCKVNTYESEGIREYLNSLGFIENESQPDYIIFNTCAVTSVAERKCRYKIHSFANRFPTSYILVTGCASLSSSEEYLKIPQVKVVSCNEGKLKSVKELINFTGEKKNLVNMKERNLYFENDLSITQFGKECRAFLKIQDGCNNFCSYCYIPYSRGNSRSRSSEMVLKEVKDLFSNGYMEIVLTGIDMGSYEDVNKKDYHFAELIEDILSITPTGRRIRISSLETGQINEKIVRLFIDNQDKLVKHLHIPLQSGSNKILRLMNRKYDLEKFSHIVKELKEAIKGFAFSTDVIVGFPTESEEDFLDTFDFIKKIEFMRLHVFPFSPRKNTPTEKMKQIDNKIKKERVKKLLKLDKFLREKFISSLNGTIVNVLFEEKQIIEGKTFYKGYSENYLEVMVESDECLLNIIREVKVENFQFKLK